MREILVAINAFPFKRNIFWESKGPFEIFFWQSQRFILRGREISFWEEIGFFCERFFKEKIRSILDENFFLERERDSFLNKTDFFLREKFFLREIFLRVSFFLNGRYFLRGRYFWSRRYFLEREIFFARVLFYKDLN